MQYGYGIGRREFLRGSAGVVLGSSLLTAGCGVGQETGSEEAVKKVVPAKVDGDLLVFNWTEYMDPELISGFEDRYKVKVRTANFDSMPSMMAKLRSGNAYDVIFPTADYVNRLVQANMLLQLDREKLRNADTIYSFFDDPWDDAKSAHTVPYAMYTTGIAWRDDKVEDISGSWNDLMNESAKGKVFMLDDFQEGIGQANLLNGFDLNETGEAELEQTQATLEQQKEFLRGYSTNAAPQLLSGAAWIHHAWNGDIINTRNQAKKNPEIYKFQTCKEGIPVGSDCMAIPVNAKSPGTALLFLDWILDPVNASQNIQYHGYPMPIEGSEDSFAELAADDPAIEVSVDDLESGSQFKELTPEERKAWDRVWTEVKA
jgi:spermidine/putrescine transport system substrate-binding protein